MNNNLYDTDQFLSTKARLKRILRRCGWTLFLRYKPSGYYVWAIKRDAEGERHSQYVAPFHRTDALDTGEILSLLPEIL